MHQVPSRKPIISMLILRMCLKKLPDPESIFYEMFEADMHMRYKRNCGITFSVHPSLEKLL